MHRARRLSLAVLALASAALLSACRDERRGIPSAAPQAASPRPTYIEKKAGRGAPVVLLGDLNTGPAIGAHIAPSLPSHYERFTVSGFLNPYAAQRDVRCTYCFDNPLEGGGGTRGLLIDHVLLRGFEGDVAGAQIMRSDLKVDVGGRLVRSGYSDHYGIIVTLSKRGS